MSAICIIRSSEKEEAIAVASDGATSNYDATMGGCVSKVLALPHLNCFVGNVGAAGVTAGLVFTISWKSYPSFDHVLANVVEDFREILAAAALYTRERDPPATVVLGGWSDERQRFESYKVNSRSREVINVATGEKFFSEPWVVTPLPQIWGSTAHPDDPENRFGLRAEGEVNLLDLAARFVCAARAGSGPDGELDPDTGISGSCVGGFLQMTLLQRDTVKTWIAHRWPDVIGEVIDPSRGELMPAFPLAIP